MIGWFETIVGLVEISETTTVYNIHREDALFKRGKELRGW